ncbi:hypothetical protein CSKR_113796 [Clonorchis sinensis]|uniref:UPAR/Ly6 domain-containing protein n=1 Tax=Clonorchis sinensis TaxID=79923 RepID=A0A8T1MDE9_CLOSI|nr:hypothetical protein CSKR_113796 [Clonorchis sinensis]KAG5447398.1 hypothetical protein CSKR_113796 [Clonorchis sinensis]
MTAPVQFLLLMSTAIAVRQTLVCYHTDFSIAIGQLVRRTESNCRYCVFEELVIAGPERRVYQSCSAFCWPYEVIGYARRICCRSSLCNANYETARTFGYSGDAADMVIISN